MSRTILVCQHQSCPQQGAASVLSALKTQAPADVEVKGSGCLGECGNGPMVIILPDKIWYCHVEMEDVPTIVEQHLNRGEPVVEKLYPKFHPSKQSIGIWLVLAGACLGLLALGFVILASHTYYF